MRRNAQGISLRLIARVAGVIAGTLALPSCQHAQRGPRTGIQSQCAASPQVLAGVPDVRQSTTYSCGAASLQAILSYWGIDKRERDLMESLGSKETTGTPPQEIIRVANELGLTAQMKDNLRIEDLKASLDRKVPVLVAIQAWVDPFPAGFSWADDWEDGHYVVVIGIDAENVYFEDPSLLGTRGVIPREEFLNRWHDYVGEPPLDPGDTKRVRLGIFIEGKEPANPPAFTPID